MAASCTSAALMQRTVRSCTGSTSPPVPALRARLRKTLRFQSVLCQVLLRLFQSKKERPLKAKLILITALALSAMAHAQGFASHVSIGIGLQGIFPAATFKNDEVNHTNSTQSTTNSEWVA